MKAFCLILLVVLASCRDYPLYKQCDAKWANQKLGTSTSTICQVGALVSSIAMALTGTGHNFNPSTMNTWLKANKGYANKDDFVWASINTFGLTFQGKIPNSLIRLNLDVGYVLLLNVKKGAHWVLATGYKQNTIYVKDSLYDVASYDISEVVTGNSGVYKAPPGLVLPVTINEIEELSKAPNSKNLASEQ